MKTIRNLARKIHYVLLSALVVCQFADASSISRSVRFQHVSRDEGLSQAFVYEIVQDRQGFIWLGTQEGLNRFDGYGFEIFRHEPEDPGSLPAGTVRALLVDTQGRLLVGASEGGLRRLDEFSGRFEPVVDTPLNSDRIRSLYEAPDGTLWIGTEGDGISRLAGGELQANPGVLKALSDADVWDVLQDSRGYLWVATSDGLFRANVDGAQLFLFEHDPGKAGSLSDSEVRVLFEDRDGTLWVGTEKGGLNRYNPATGTFDIYLSSKADDTSLASNRVTSIRQDESGVLWIGTTGGLNAFDATRDSFERYRNEPGNHYSLANNSVLSIFEDAGNVLWVGTYKGVDRWNTTSSNMRHYRTAVNKDLGSDSITSFAEHVSGDIWIGTFGGGLHLFDPETHRFERFLHEPGNINSPREDTIMSLAVDRRGRLWIGTRSSGLSVVESSAAGKAYQHFEFDEADPTSLSANGVTTILEDSYGQVWVGTYGGGLNRFDPASNSFVRFRHDPRIRGSLGGNQVLALLEDSDRVLWVGTEDGGLNRFDRREQSFTAFRQDKSDPESLGSDYVTTLAEDGDGNLWVGTVGRGLFRLSAAEKRDEKLRFKRYSERDGLPSGTIYAAAWVPSKHLWVTTNEGIARIDVHSEQISAFSTADGLQDPEFNLGAGMKSSRGLLYFGGVNGFNEFSPNRVDLNLHLPPTVITGIRRGNESVLASELDEGGVLTLGHRDYLVSFEFAGLDYTAPEKNRYRYRLEGLDSGWIDAGSRRSATYTNLSPGSYTFKVQSSNNSGLWSAEETSLPLKVAAAPWLTWWAYCLYGLVISMVGWFILSGQIHRMRNAGTILATNQALENEIRIRQGREKELRLERDRHSQYLQVAEVLMIELDERGRIQLINVRGLAMLGRLESSVVGQSLLDFVPPRYRQRVSDELANVTIAGNFEDEYLEFPVVSAAGEEHVVLWRAGALSETSRSNKTFLISGMDVTELRQLENAVRKKEKMSVMGTLAGGIAHDFNNILTAIYGYGQLTLGEVAEDTMAARNLTNIISAAERAKNLVARLLTFARSEEKEFVPSDVGLVVKEVGELLVGSLPSTIRLSVDVSPALSPVMGDATQMHQILMNLCTNAAKALKDTSGEINVRAKSDELGDADLPPGSDLTPGRHVILSVSDNGVGMDSDTLNKVFDPFFTTDATGYGNAEKGTGLGLSVVYSIVGSHDGHISVESEEGKGTTFTIYLPCCELLPALEEEVPAEAESEESAHIFLVDDEDLVGDVGKQLLEVMGYEVTLFAEPEAALDALRTAGDSVDLLITDETMPGMTGTQLAKQMRCLNSVTPVIVASGNMQELTGLENAFFLRKPYSIVDLRDTVTKALRARSSHAALPLNNVVRLPGVQS